MPSDIPCIVPSRLQIDPFRGRPTTSHHDINDTTQITRSTWRATYTAANNAYNPACEPVFASHPASHPASASPSAYARGRAAASATETAAAQTTTTRAAVAVVDAQIVQQRACGWTLECARAWPRCSVRAFWHDAVLAGRPASLWRTRPAWAARTAAPYV